MTAPGKRRWNPSACSASAVWADRSPWWRSARPRIVSFFPTDLASSNRAHPGDCCASSAPTATPAPLAGMWQAVRLGKYIWPWPLARSGHFGLAGHRTIPPRPGSSDGRGLFPCSGAPHREPIPPPGSTGPGRVEHLVIPPSSDNKRSYRYG